MAIPIFIVAHWYTSLFFQTFFLHRYSAHKMFKLSKFWEKAFYLMSYVVQGTSFLNPRTYAILHRMHHAYSDTELDPHSPVKSKNIFDMMWKTKKIYNSVYHREVEVPKEMEGGYPEWKTLDKFGESWFSRISWMFVYTGIYFLIAPNYYWFFLLPLHFILLPTQGAIVNWFGHKHGYTNYDNHDNSKNTLAVDFLMMGELFQNNHHKLPLRPNFGIKWFEFDPTYQLMKVLNFFGVLKLKYSGKKPSKKKSMMEEARETAVETMEATVEATSQAIDALKGKETASN